MAFSEQYLDADEIHPIDLVERVADLRDWEVERVDEDQIALGLTGQWRDYRATLAWQPADETLRLACCFEMDPPEPRLPQILDLINRINDRLWVGGFVWWDDRRVMAYRYGLALAGGQVAGPEQVDRMIEAAFTACERFYPAFQLVSWAHRDPAAALQIAIAEAYGRA
ncbi:YbjN domain-containing protein [Limimaricola pyoseonensis]|uniref:Sensory transduction regulator n=1 Tax=Limimaricola pyoseonensis TaxID=521013 RepID=A0A1G7ICK0_9RHOB|nr:YbjN domain-containing protein [Limimaricola pyoseonensis]SDF10432.1 hypothetical protein SAMN04488567_3411 [Limimaricola pyoseonensis]